VTGRTYLSQTTARTKRRVPAPVLSIPDHGRTWRGARSERLPGVVDSKDLTIVAFEDTEFEPPANAMTVRVCLDLEGLPLSVRKRN
jgi:hypothetical protein